MCSVQEEELGKLGAKQRMAYWERQKDLEREMDMREIEEYKETQRLIDEGVVGFLPEKISNRMLKRLVSSQWMVVLLMSEAFLTIIVPPLAMAGPVHPSAGRQWPGAVRLLRVPRQED